LIGGAVSSKINRKYNKDDYNVFMEKL